MTTHARTAPLTVLAAVGLLLLGPAALAQNKFWTNAAGGPFNVPTNWSGGVPGPSDYAIFNLNAVYTVTVPTSPTNEVLIVRNGHPTLDFEDTPGYTITDLAFIGDQGGFTTQLTILNNRLDTIATYIGFDAFSNGTFNVTGPGAEWVCTTLAVVGRSGVGTVNITNGGSATLGNVSLGDQISAASGTLIASDPGTTVSFSASLSCGESGTGLLRFENGASATALIANIGLGGGGSGALEVDDATFSSSEVTIIGSFGHGEISITGGGDVSSVQGIMASFANSSGVGTISGANSRWFSNGTFQIGREGSATLTVENEGRVEVVGNAFLGSVLGSSGELVVTGANSLVQATQQLQVGREGSGELIVSNGGAVTSTGAGSASQAAGLIGGFATGMGETLITGADSRWTVTNGSMNVGFFGAGTLTIEDGGRVESPSGFVGRLTDSSGEVDIIGPDAHWTNTGALRIGADPNGVDSGAGAVRLHAGGRVAATTLTVGALGSLGGVGDVDGNVVNRGVVQPGSPAGALNIDGAYSQTSVGEFRVAFAPSETVGHGALVVSGDANVAGAIRILVEEAFVPDAGDYTVLSAESRTGMFTTVIPPEDTGGLLYSVQYTPTSVVVRIQTCPGDANGDFIVDFADFSQVLAEYGMTGPDLEGDLNGDGVVDFADFSEVLANYGTNCAP